MRRWVAILFLALGLLALTGCDEGVDFLLGEEINFHPEGGPYQYVLSQAVLDAANDFDYAKYRDKKVYVTVTGPTQYTQALAEDAIAGRLTQEKTKVLTRLTDNEKAKGLTEEKGDYDLTFTMPVCGVHSFDGLLRKNITGLAFFRLSETDGAGNTSIQIGELHRLPYRGWVFSAYFIVAFLALVVIALTLILVRVMGNSRDEAPRHAKQEISAGR